MTASPQPASDTARINTDFDESIERTRTLEGALQKVVFAVGIILSLFALATMGVYTIDPWWQRGVFYTGALALIFLLVPATKNSPRRAPSWLDILLALLAFVPTIYLIVAHEDLVYRVGVKPTTEDVAAGILVVLLTIEAGRRLQGWALPIIALVFVGYALLGHDLPGMLGHKRYSVERLTSFMFSTEGLYGQPLGAASTFVVLFILLGAFMHSTGAGRYFIDLSLALAGGRRGGPAKVSVLASALFGTISGSAVSNVVTTGTFTIPLMKSIGYRPYFAGAVEAVASTGGQIMPPVMSAAAFIMAEITGIPYATIAIAAIIPALLYFVTVLLVIDLEAINRGLKGLPRDQLPPLGPTFRGNAHLLIPILVLLYMLIIEQSSPVKAALYSIGATILASWLRRATGVKLRGLAQALYKGALGTMDISVTCALAGIIVGVLALTGLGVKFADVLVGYAGGQLLLTLFFSMIVCLVLGMGIPTIAAYLIAASTVAPAITSLGVSDLAAHLFVLYFSAISTITPPVAISAYAGASIAGANPMKVGFTASRLGITAYIVPFMFVYGPALLLVGSFTEVAWSSCAALAGVFLLSHALQNIRFGHPERLLLGLGGLMLINQGLVTDAIGIGLGALAWGVHRVRQPKVETQVVVRAQE